ncbi:protein FAM83B isoform X2 [Denticeps clupeoides]|nr:protein FAM83B isoform X2 [Denticeps clupeoides]
MDVFTDVDIFKEIVEAATRGVPVYVLLDDYKFKSFLTMAENQDVQIKKLRNMRVRTVKGLEYLCRSGAKFHGLMEQKFLLIDCQTVFFGSYSFMWSYEKINLSMVQVIRGHLVESYDEEFRTLYARSTVPAELMPEGGPSDKRQNGKTDAFSNHIMQPFERTHQLRHTLDAVYKRTCERQGHFKLPMGDMEARMHDFEPLNLPPMVTQNLLAAAEHNGFLKRHSYAGERQDGTAITPQLRYGVSNWNVTGNGYSGPLRIPYSGTGEEHHQVPDRIYRGADVRQSYHGNSKQFLSLQKNMPSLEQTSKSFLRTWRIESYLNNNDALGRDGLEYLEPCEVPENKAPPYLHSRLRSSLVFKSTIPEQPETNSYSNNSSNSMQQNGPYAMPSNAPFPSPMRWNQPEPVEDRPSHDDFLLKRRSLQILDDPRQAMNFNSGRQAYQSVYASLGRARGRLASAEQELLQDDRFKRHSVADPKSNMFRENKECSSYMYNSLMRRQAERQGVHENVANRAYTPNFSEDQRSVSHYDVKRVEQVRPSAESMWQEPPSRTVSATVLDESDKALNHPKKTSGIGSPHFFKSSSKRIKSLLNIPEKKDGSSKSRSSLGPQGKGSSDTILSEDDERRRFGGSANSTKSTDSQKRANGLDLNKPPFGNSSGKSSTPRFSTEELLRSTSTGERTTLTPATGANNAKASLTTRDGWRRDRNGEVRAYSRFEPFSVLDNKSLIAGQSGAAERHRNLLFIKGDRGYHPNPPDNKLGRLFQRMGNFINKNK